MPFFVFAVKAFDPSTLHREILAYYTQNEIPPEHQLDAVCINGVGMIKNIKHPELNLYTADPPLGRSAGWYLESWGESACLGFLLSLEYSYPSAPTISESILRRVLTRIGKTHVNRLGDDS